MDFENIPIQSTPQGYATPDQIAQQRKIAQLLMMGPGQQQKPTHPAQLFGNLANSAVGNMQLNQANALERASKLQDAGQVTEGTQEPQQPDLVKNAASHFALLAQKYSGKPVGAAVDEWTKGHPGAQFIPEKAGLTPETPITPELLKGQQGIALVKAMADLDAGGRAPLTDQQWVQAHQMAFGGPQTSGGGGGGEEGGSQALAYGDPQGSPGGANPMGGMVAALQAPKTGAVPPVPGGPVTRAPGGEAPTNWKDYPDSTLPHRVPMNGDALVKILASDWLDPSVKNNALQLYLDQSQPMSMKAPGGTISIGADRQRAFIPELMKGKYKTGDTEAELLSTYDPRTNTQNFVPTGGGGAGGGAQGPLGTAPPSSTPAPGQQRGNAVFPPPIINDMQNYSNTQDALKRGREQLHKDFEKNSIVAEKAQTSLPTLTLLRQMIEDPNLYQGIFADPILDWNRFKAAIGSKGGERAAALMQTMEKVRSGQIITDLKTQLGGLGQVRVEEIKLVNRASASVYNTREANRAVLDLAIRNNEQVTALSELHSKYIQGYQFDKNGNEVLGPDGAPVIGDPGKASAAGLQRLKLDWLKAHPMISPEQIKEYNRLFDEDSKYPVPKATKGNSKTKPVTAPAGTGGVDFNNGWKLDPRPQ